MDEDEQLYAMRKAAQNVVEAAQKTLGDLNGAIAQLRGLTSGLQSVSVATLHQVEQGAQKGIEKALQQAPKVDLAPQIDAAVKPTLNSVRSAVSNLSSATTEAGAAARALAKHRIDWYQNAIYLMLGFIVGCAFVWFCCLRSLRDIQQSLGSVPIVQCVSGLNQPPVPAQKSQSNGRHHQKQSGPEQMNADPESPPTQ